MMEQEDVAAAIVLDKAKIVPAVCTTDRHCDYPDRMNLVEGHCCSACCARLTPSIHRRWRCSIIIITMSAFVIITTTAAD